jgi:hypothetical protein
MDGSKFNPEVAEKRTKSRPKYKAQVLNQRGRIVAITIIALVVIIFLMGLIVYSSVRSSRLNEANIRLVQENEQIRGFLDKKATVTIEPSVRGL